MPRSHLCLCLYVTFPLCVCTSLSLSFWLLETMMFKTPGDDEGQHLMRRGKWMNSSAHGPNRVSGPWIGEGECRRSPEDSQNREDTPGFPGRTRPRECCCCLVTQLECTGLSEEGQEQRASENCVGPAGKPLQRKHKIVQRVWKTAGQFLKNLNTYPTQDPANPLWKIQPVERKAYVHTETCTHVFIATLFLITSNQKWPDIPQLVSDKLW